MNIGELFLLALALSMDAFAVAICKGLSLSKIHIKHCIKVGLWFGGFQALMPCIGFFAASLFSHVIQSFDHWVAFVLLAIIGINMIKESRESTDEDTDASLGFKVMFMMAIATSIDALAVGITFAFLNVNIFTAALLIGATTFTCCAIGVKIGNVFGAKHKGKAEFAGGLILILLGIRILLEHLGILVL